MDMPTRGSHAAVPRPRAGLLRRPRPEALLDAAVERPLTVVVAAAGTGKTSLVTAWAVGRPDVRWQAEAGTPTVPDRDERSPAAHPQVVVVDDVDTADPGTVRELVRLAYSGQGPHVVLLGRDDPPGPWRDDGAPDLVSRLTTEDLRLDDDESTALLARLLPVSPPPGAGATGPHAPVGPDVQALVDRCGGWAQLLVLSARSWRSTPGDRLVEGPLLDWVDETVLAALPLRSRLAMLVAAVPSGDPARVAAVLADDVTAPDTLDGLVRRGLLRQQGDGWACHPVLAQALLRRTGRGGPDHAAATRAHARAAAHLHRHGAPAPALHHGVRSGDRRQVAQVLLAHGIALVLGGEEDLVSAALEVVDASSEDDRPATLLLGVSGMLLRARGDTERATHAAARAIAAARQLAADLAAAGRGPDLEEAALLVDAASLQAWSARFGWSDVPGALAATAGVLGELDPPATHPRAVDGADLTRLCLLLRETAALETWAGRLDLAAVHTDRALVTAEAIANPRLRAAALADRSLVQVMRGELGLAARTARECLHHAARADRPSDGYLARPHLALGLAAFYDLRLGEAAEELVEARRILARAPEPLLAGLALLLEVWLEAARGDVGAARSLLADSPPFPEAAPPLLAGAEAFVGSQLALLDDDLDVALRLGEQLRCLGSTLGADVVVSGVLEARGDVRAASALLTDALGVVPSWGGEEVAAVLAEARLARLLAAAGENDASRRRLRSVLGRASRHQLAQPVLMGLGPAAGRLLSDLRDVDAALPVRPMVDALLARAAAVGPPVALGPREHGPGRATVTVDLPLQGEVLRTSVSPRAVPPAAMTVDAYVPPLTEREQDVLRGLALGESYSDVAASLYLSENTVKTHVASLYRKLGVGRRSLALRRARELGLI